MPKNICRFFSYDRPRHDFMNPFLEFFHVDILDFFQLKFSQEAARNA